MRRKPIDTMLPDPESIKGRSEGPDRKLIRSKKSSEADDRKILRTKINTNNFFNAGLLRAWRLFFMLVALAAFSVSFRASAQKRCAPVVAPLTGIAAAVGGPSFQNFAASSIFSRSGGDGVFPIARKYQRCVARVSDTHKQGFCVGEPVKRRSLSGPRMAKRSTRENPPKTDSVSFFSFIPAREKSDIIVGHNRCHGYGAKPSETDSSRKMRASIRTVSEMGKRGEERGEAEGLRGKD